MGMGHDRRGAYGKRHIGRAVHDNKVGYMVNQGMPLPDFMQYFYRFF
jgi:hypothetical protein